MAKHTSLTNLELAGNPTWVIASTFSECPFCGFLSGDLELVRVSVPCPKCELSGSARLIFPDISCIRWLEMIGDSYVTAYARTSEKQAELAEQIRSDLKRSCDAEWVAAALKKVRKLRRKSPGSTEEYNRFLETLQKRLSLDTREEGQRIYPYLASFEEPSNEHCNLVVSTESLYRKLLSGLIIRLLVSGGMAYVEARKKARTEWRYAELVRLFEKQAHITLREAVMGFGVRGLYDRWRHISTLRNRYSHESPLSVNSEVAEKAFDLAKNAFGLFAFLQNTYCVVISG
jgi:hypothetical protein